MAKSIAYDRQLRKAKLRESRKFNKLSVPRKVAGPRNPLGHNINSLRPIF